MKLGILQTGGPPAGLEGFGSYPAMFEKLLGEASYEYAVHDVRAGQLPARPDACAAYILTGSDNGVHDAEPWIADLMRFLRGAKGRAALVGICFGHQLMAETFGGKVIPSPNGWGLGAHTYDVLRPRPWLNGARRITLPASHQDQVVELPPHAEAVAASAFCPFGVIAYTDQPAISLQLHPEFEPDYAAALVERRRGDGLTAEQADRAAASLHGPNDRAHAADWIRTFLATATK